MQNNHPSAIPELEIPQPVAADWLWRPWYAKLWWAAIPIYWATMATSLKTPALSPLFETGLAGYLYVLFFPPTALLVLGFGFIRASIHAWGRDEGPPLTAGEIEELVEIRRRNKLWPEQRPGYLDPAFDIYDERSGMLFVGNPNGINSGNPL
jgi:hypothetical protein